MGSAANTTAITSSSIALSIIVRSCALFAIIAGAGFCRIFCVQVRATLATSAGQNFLAPGRF